MQEEPATVSKSGSAGISALQGPLPQLGAVGAIIMMLWSAGSTTNQRIDALAGQVSELRVLIEVRSAARWTRQDHATYAAAESSIHSDLRERIDALRMEVREMQADRRER